MKPASTAKNYCEAFLRLLFPAHCGVCRSFLRLEEEGICDHCHDRLQSLKFSLEEAPIEESFQDLDEGWTLYPYESPVKDMITAIKFSKKRWLVRVFQEDIRNLASAIASETAYDYLIPVPIDRGRLIEREFNQAELIARLLSFWTQIPIRRNLLHKRRSVPSQSLLTREERRANPFGVFGISKKKNLKGKTFLLVDDIFTTGATAEEAARCLKNGGAKRVDLFALARTEMNS